MKQYIALKSLSEHLPVRDEQRAHFLLEMHKVVCIDARLNAAPGMIEDVG